MNKLLTLIGASAFLLVALLFTGSGTQVVANATCSATGNETVATGQEDYKPDETVDISGAGYGASCDVTVKVTRPNGSVVSGDGTFEAWPKPYDTVSTEPDGTFTFDYILNGIQGEYLLEVLGDGDVVLASTTFLDGVSTVLEGAGDWSLAGTGSTCTSPENAVSDGAPSTNVRATCAFGQTVVARDFDIQSVVPASATDISFVVTTRAGVSASDDTDNFDVSLSWDGGATYTSTIASEQVNDPLGGAGDDNADAPPVGSNCAATSNFGRTWTYAELTDANFRAKVAAHPRTNVPSAGTNALLQTMDIDDIDLTVCWTARVITAATIIAPEANNPGTRTVSVSVNHTLATGFSGGSTADDWRSVSYLVEGQSTLCADTPDNNAAGTDTEIFEIEPPLTGGPYDLTLIAYSDDACSTLASSPFTLTDGIVIAAGPTLHRSTESKTSSTFAHTVPAGANRLLVVAVMIDAVDDATGVTYGGSPLTLELDMGIAGGCSDCQRVEIYYMVAPPVGTADVVVTFGSDTLYQGVAAVNFTGVDQSDPIGATATTRSTGNTISRSITTTFANSTLLGVNASGSDAPAPFTTSSPNVELWDAITAGGGAESADASLWGALQATTTVGSYTMSTTGSGLTGNDFAIAVVEIKTTAVADADGDGVPDDTDNCPNDANADQADGDSDGAGDVCDPCPTDNPDDIDGDGVCTSADNCPNDANADQADGDSDGAGDVCDP
jgi:hypothetical protein